MLVIKSFTIDQAICGSTGKPFGAKYAGTFTLRRPSLLDKKNIAVKDAASMSFAGELAPGTISEGTAMISYIFSFVTTLNNEPLPEWFDMAKMYEPEDEDAILAVWSEVVRWLDTFRSKTDGEAGSGAVEHPAVLVQKTV